MLPLCGKTKFQLYLQQLTSYVIAVSPDGLPNRSTAHVRPSYMLDRHPLGSRPGVAVPGHGRPLPEVIGRDVLRHPRSRVPAKSFPCCCRVPTAVRLSFPFINAKQCHRWDRVQPLFTLAAVCGRRTAKSDWLLRRSVDPMGEKGLPLASLPRSFLRFVFLPYASLVRFPTGTRPLARRRVDRRGRCGGRQRARLVSRNGRRRETNFSRSPAAR